MKLSMRMQCILWISAHLFGFNSCKTTAPVEKDLRIVSELPRVLTECSGMTGLGGNIFVALNDSGNKPYLYEFSTDNIKEVRVIKVRNAVNHDWEELADDEEHLYIGDFGNNGGTRRNLMIYKIRKTDLQSNDEVTPEIITFRYEGQTSFNHSNRHNFDCEAMICKGDSLFLFSKNRGDFRTDVYGLPKTPGDHVTRIMGSFDTEGLVTGADYRDKHPAGELVLIGYSIHGKAFYPFIVHFPEVEGSKFVQGDFIRKDFNQVLQTETISFFSENKVYITNEEKDITGGSNSKGYIYEASLGIE